MYIELREQIGIIISSAKEEAVINVALTSSQGKLVLQGFEGSSLRHCVGHIKIGCHASSSRSPTLRLHIGLFCQAWLTKMHMIIDYTW